MRPLLPTPQHTVEVKAQPARKAPPRAQAAVGVAGAARAAGDSFAVKGQAAAAPVISPAETGVKHWLSTAGHYLSNKLHSAEALARVALAAAHAGDAAQLVDWVKMALQLGHPGDIAAPPMEVLRYVLDDPQKRRCASSTRSTKSTGRPGARRAGGWPTAPGGST